MVESGMEVSESLRDAGTEGRVMNMIERAAHGAVEEADLSVWVPRLDRAGKPDGVKNCMPLISSGLRGMTGVDEAVGQGCALARRGRNITCCGMTAAIRGGYSGSMFRWMD